MVCYQKKPIRSAISSNVKLRIEYDFPPQCIHYRQRNANVLRFPGPASDSFKSKPIAVRNRIRNQMELLAITAFTRRALGSNTGTAILALQRGTVSIE